MTSIGGSTVELQPLESEKRFPATYRPSGIESLHSDAISSIHEGTYRSASSIVHHLSSPLPTSRSSVTQSDESTQHNIDELKDIRHQLRRENEKRKLLELTEDQIRFGVNIQPKSCIIDPSNPLRIFWDVMVVLLVLFNAFEKPFTTGFLIEPTPSFQAFDLFIDIFFVVDIIINFLTTYEDDGFLVNDYSSIASHYCHSYFIIDVVSTIPVDKFVGLFNPNLDKLRIIFPLSCLILLRMTKIMKVIRKWTDNVSYAMRIFIAMIWLVFWAHLVACVFHWIGLIEINDGQHSWINEKNLLNAPLVTKYSFALYFSVKTVTTVGYGDVVPVTVRERYFVCAVMIISALCYASIFGSVSLSLANMSRSFDSYQQRVDTLEMYMQDLGLNADFRKRVKRYVEYLWTKNHGLSDPLLGLPERLQLEAKRLTHENMLRLNPIFVRQSQQVITQFALNMKLVVALPGETIIIEDEIARRVYFVSKGTVELSEGDTVMTYINKGSYFGEVPFFLQECKGYNVSAKAVTYCDLYTLEAEHFYELIDQYSLIHRIMFEVATARYYKSEFYFDDGLLDRVVINSFRRNPDQNGDGSSMGRQLSVSRSSQGNAFNFGKEDAQIRIAIDNCLSESNELDRADSFNSDTDFSHLCATCCTPCCPSLLKRSSSDPTDQKHGHDHPQNPNRQRNRRHLQHRRSNSATVPSTSNTKKSSLLGNLSRIDSRRTLRQPIPRRKKGNEKFNSNVHDTITKLNNKFLELTDPRTGLLKKDTFVRSLLSGSSGHFLNEIQLRCAFELIADNKDAVDERQFLEAFRHVPLVHAEDSLTGDQLLIHGINLILEQVYADLDREAGNDVRPAYDERNASLLGGRSYRPSSKNNSPRPWTGDMLFDDGASRAGSRPGSPDPEI